MSILSETEKQLIKNLSDSQKIVLCRQLIDDMQKDIRWMLETRMTREGKKKYGYMWLTRMIRMKRETVREYEYNIALLEKINTL